MKSELAPDIEDADQEADAEGLAALDAGRVVTGEAVIRWVLSWGTADEPPPPRSGD